MCKHLFALLLKHVMYKDISFVQSYTTSAVRKWARLVNSSQKHS